MIKSPFSKPEQKEDNNEEIEEFLNKSPENFDFKLPLNRYEINLPPLINYIYSLPSNEFKKASDLEMQNLRKNIIKVLEKYHFCWKYNPDQKIPNYQNHYKYKLPESVFTNEQDIQKISLPQYKFNSLRTPLNKTQRNDVWKTRTFKVPSEMEKLPHLWQVSSWLLNSSEERKKFAKKILSICLRLFYAIPNVINPYSERVIRANVAESLAKPNLFNVFVNFLAFFLNLYDFFFGFSFKTLDNNYYHNACTNASKKSFYELFKLKEKFPETYNFVEVSLDKIYKNPELKKINDELKSFGPEFENEFNLFMKNELNQDDFEDDEVEAMKKQILETKQDKLYEFLIKKSEKSNYPQYINFLIKKIKAFYIYRRLIEEKKNLLEKERNSIRNKLIEERPIFSLINYKKNRFVDEKSKPYESQLESEFRANLEKELKEQNLTEEIILAKYYFNYLDNKNMLEKQEINQMRKHDLKPVNTFTIRYPLFASRYKLKFRNNYWILIKEGEIKIYSDFMFYKVVKALVSYVIKTYSLTFKITKWVWESQFGIKCLFGYSEYYTDFSIVSTLYIESDKPQLLLNKDKKRPILRKFVGVMHGIQKSRRKFEQAPDNGFFGKNCGRICNLFNCFIIRFLFVGVLIILIIHPIINILSIIGGIIAGFTVIIWLFFVEIFLLIWKLLIYDYKSTLRHHTWKNDNFNIEFYQHNFLKLLKSYRFFSLVHLLLDFLFNVILQFVMVIIMIIFSPIISLFCFIFGMFLYFFKSIWDFLILNSLIRCFARVPSSDSTFAHRISGPGISRDFYNSLESKHLSMLIIAHLEKLELDQLHKEINEIIEYPRKFIQEKIEIALEGLSKTPSQNYFITESFKNIEYLKTSLNLMIEQRKNHLPAISGGHYTIRFTGEDLEKNEEIVQGILKNFIAKKNMDRYIWDQYELREGLYKRLTRKIMQQILSADAIKPVEYIDRVQKVKFSENKNSLNDYIANVINEGEDNYKIKNEKRALRNIKNKVEKSNGQLFVSIEEIFSYYNYQNFMHTNPFLFCLFNEDEIKIFEEYNNINLDLNHVILIDENVVGIN